MTYLGTQPVRQKVKVADNPQYLRDVRELACIACGRPGPTEPHHCKDKPPFEEQGIDKRLPSTSKRSADEDTIPLCPPDHRMFHLERPKFHALYGKDYTYIAATREAVEQAREIRF